MSEKVMPSTRDDFVDVVKGVCIVLMVYGHINFIGTLKNQQVQIVEWIYTFHMPIFFLVSGMYFKWAGDVGDIGRRVLSRLVRPYLVFSLLYLSALWVFENVFGVSSRNTPPQTAAAFFSNLVLNPIGGYWFLHAIIAIQIAFVVAGYVAGAVQARRLVIAFGLCVALTSAHIVEARAAIYFFLGLVVAGMGGASLVSNIGVGMLLVLIGAMGLQPGNLNVTLTQTCWVLGLLSVIAGLAQIWGKALAVRALGWMGRNTLAILVLHAGGLLVARLVINKLGGGDAEGVFHVALSMLLGLGGPIVAAMFFDRMKLSRHLFGVKHIYSRL